MTVDFGVRHTAKKQWRRHAQDAEKRKLEAGAPKRIRKKHNAKRRMCKGMCYQDPAATQVDKQWHEGNSDDEKAAAAAYDSDLDEDTKRTESGQTATTSAPAQQGGAAKAPRKGKQAMKMSTGVQLLDPEAASDSVPKSSAKRSAAAAAASAPVPAALQPFHPLIQRLMTSQGHTEPTPIQEQCWPACCEGKDVQGLAEPGSGKTLAYLLPGVVRLKEAGHDAASLPDGPLLLVLTPTRELATQVAQQCRHLRTVAGLRTACVYGGVPKEQQEELLQKKPHVVVATPGRLLDLLDSGATTLDKVSYIVLDEADKMLGLGFQQQLDRLHELLLGAHKAADAKAAAPVKKGKKRAAEAEAGLAPAPSSRPQVLLFTATMPPEVLGATDRWLRSPTRVTVSHSAASISRTIVQVVQVCAEHKKPAKLLRHLAAVKASGAEMRNPPRVLVFANRIKTVRFLHDAVSNAGYRVVMLHGQRSQPEREDAMRSFRSGKCQIMVATDVAARGLDIRALPYVVNYDFPTRLESYIHRVGRTGRLAANGHAFSFFTRNLAKVSSPLVDLLNLHQQAVDPNLLVLADAWKEAVDRAGGEQALEAQLKKAKAAGGGKGEEDDEEGEGEEEEGGQDELDALMTQRLEAADVMEGLRSAGVLSKGKKKAKSAPAQEQDVGGSGPASKKGTQAEDVAAAAAPSMQQRLVKAKKAGAVEAAHQSELGAMAAAFVAAPKFSGARAGYLFKLGPQGQGYYKDTAPKVARKAGAAQLQQRGKGPIIPTGRSKHSWSDDDDDEDEGAGVGGKAPKAALGGKAAGGKGGKSGQQSGSKDSGRKKAMPGRLRRKLKAQAK